MYFMRNLIINQKVKGSAHDFSWGALDVVTTLGGRSGGDQEFLKLGLPLGAVEPSDDSETCEINRSISSLVNRPQHITKTFAFSRWCTNGTGTDHFTVAGVNDLAVNAPWLDFHKASLR